MADRRDAKANQIAIGVGGVAHEIAMQATALLRLCQVIIGQGEMIHADIDIASRSEFFHRQLQQR